MSRVTTSKGKVISSATDLDIEDFGLVKVEMSPANKKEAEGEVVNHKKEDQKSVWQNANTEDVNRTMLTSGTLVIGKKKDVEREVIKSEIDLIKDLFG